MVLGRIDSALTFVLDPGSGTMRVSAAKTCCAKASKARDKMVTMAPKEAKYLLIISKTPPL